MTTDGSITDIPRDVYVEAEGVQAKIKKLSPEARGKLQETMQRIVNEGVNGLICIII